MFGMSVGIVGIPYYKISKIDFTKQWNKNTKWYGWIRSVFFVFKFWKGLQLRLIVCVSVLGNVDEAFSGCSAGIQATSLSGDIVFFNVYNFIKSSFSWLLDTRSIFTYSRVQDGFLWTTGGKWSPFLLNQNPSSQDFTGGGESWTSDIWFIFCPRGALERCRFCFKRTIDK